MGWRGVETLSGFSIPNSHLPLTKRIHLIFVQMCMFLPSASVLCRFALLGTGLLCWELIPCSHWPSSWWWLSMLACLLPCLRLLSCFLSFFLSLVLVCIPSFLYAFHFFMRFFIEELAVFTNMAPERLCLGCGLRAEEKFTPIFPGERGSLFAASVKLPCVLLAHRPLQRAEWGYTRKDPRSSGRSGTTLSSSRIYPQALVC